MNLKTLRAALPRTPEIWLDEIIRELPDWGIDTPNETATFIAQCAHESDEFTRLEENLNYSAERLMRVWPRLFPTHAIALEYRYQPEKLANYVYDDSNRPKSKLGNIHPGDGWRFRGRGPIQITGRRNYEQCGIWIGEDLILHPELLLQPKQGIRSALWYWKIAGLNEIDDNEDQRLDTRRINGGETGLAYRQQLFNHILHHLEAA